MLLLSRNTVPEIPRSERSRFSEALLVIEHAFNFLIWNQFLQSSR